MPSSLGHCPKVDMLNVGNVGKRKSDAAHFGGRVPHSACNSRLVVLGLVAWTLFRQCMPCFTWLAIRTTKSKRAYVRRHRRTARSDLRYGKSPRAATPR